MVWFDPKLQKILVRLVYDGPAHAGKTTNVAQLAAAFTTLRRGELLVPEEKNGRTLYFDWLHLDGGVIAGHGLRCQLLTVPGQSLLAQRRWHLVETADVLVFVCDSTSAGVREAKRSFEIFRARYCDAARPRAIVVQANKQDAADALAPEWIAEELDLGRDIPVVAARAIAGVGVRETAVVAIRAAADIAQQLVLTKGIDALERPNDGPEELVATLKPLGSARRPRHRDARTWAPATVHAETGLPLPHAGVPHGYVWPAARGRATLQAIESACTIAKVEALPNTGNRALFRIAGFSLEASGEPFSSAEQALTQMLAVAQTKVRLGTLCPEETTLAVIANENRFWLWSIGPALPTFEEALAVAPPRVKTLESLGKALAESLRIAHTHSIVLIADPALLAASGAGFVYYGDVQSGDAPLRATAESMLDGLIRVRPTSTEHVRLAQALWFALESDTQLTMAVHVELERCANAEATDRSQMASRLLEQSSVSPLD
ncbi:hypothetical protein LVJ94_32725 [Pendulispora rubella]|uniref:Uncharacterized protein n=1 Tax=Pendulispora rubella TaxID=2741070 RepID=A0ABZ2KT11_9BACT